MSTFSGPISEICGVSIDRFDGVNLNSTTYFLSHCHSDHMEGIRNERFIKYLAENPDVYLYCSQVTSLILKSSGLSSVHKKIVALTIGPENMLFVPQGDRRQILVVTLIPAGHCPGSVMFLFEGDFGNILYTGDFRISAEDVTNLKQFYDTDRQTKPITKIYLDTTFIGLYGTKAENFPSRTESAAEIIRLISQWLDQGNDRSVTLFTSARYGSEYLFIDIATNLRTQVRVPDDSYQVYGAVPDISWAVTNDPSAKIQAYGLADRYSKKGSRSDRKLQSVNEPNKPSADKVRIIKPAALWWCNNHSQDQTISCQYSGEFFRVMYACHSSPQEIKALLHFLRPCAIEPCVVPDGFTFGEISSICYSMMEELRPVTSSISCTPPPCASNCDSVSDRPMASGTSEKTETVDLVSHSNPDSHTTSYSDDDEYITPSPTYILD